MATSANPAHVVNRNIPRWVFRWIHIIFGIPILGYIYDSPSDTHNYASSVRYFFSPVCSFPSCGCERPRGAATVFEEAGLGCKLTSLENINP
jgi:hypothetical protein